MSGTRNAASKRFARALENAHDDDRRAVFHFTFYARVPAKKRRVAHFWDGQDTLCKMASTGGIRVTDRYEETPLLPPGHRVCTMCQNNAAKRMRGQHANT